MSRQLPHKTHNYGTHCTFLFSSANPSMFVQSRLTWGRVGLVWAERHFLAPLSVYCPSLGLFQSVLREGGNRGPSASSFGPSSTHTLLSMCKRTHVIIKVYVQVRNTHTVRMRRPADVAMRIIRKWLHLLIRYVCTIVYSRAELGGFFFKPRCVEVGRGERSTEPESLGQSSA